MRKGKIFRGWLVVCMALMSLTSCLKDDAYDIDGLMFAIGDIHIIGGNDYYFELDEGSTLYPGDTTDIHQYPLKEGQRAFVYFTLLDEPRPGYDYNVSLKHIENILTKDICRMTPSMADSIGDDRIDVDDIWLSSHYLNIVYKFYHSNNPDKPHMLNLVVNEADTVADDRYVRLEFRHNAYNDMPLQGGTGIVSFRLDSIRPLLEGHEGLRIRVRTLYEGEKEYVVSGQDTAGK